MASLEEEMCVKVVFVVAVAKLCFSCISGENEDTYCWSSTAIIGYNLDQGSG